MRIGKDNYNRLRLIQSDLKEELGISRLSFDKVFDILIEERETSAFFPTLYRVGDRVFSDLKKARGHAIVESVKQGADILVEHVRVIGFDE